MAWKEGGYSRDGRVRAAGLMAALCAMMYRV